MLLKCVLVTEEENLWQLNLSGPLVDQVGGHVKSSLNFWSELRPNISSASDWIVCNPVKASIILALNINIREDCRIDTIIDSNAVFDLGVFIIQVPLAARDCESCLIPTLL